MNPTKRQATERINLTVEKWYLALELGPVRKKKKRRRKGERWGKDKKKSKKG
jgi:hypothetical protein